MSDVSLGSDDHITSFLMMSLLYRDTCDSYSMGDGERVVRNAHLEWLYASTLHHTKYALWLWRMISYAIAILSPKQSFEYIWNMTTNLKGGNNHNIPNDNCVEIQVQKIKKELQCQGANKSFQSAKMICMTTQVTEGIKEQLMKTTNIAKPGRTRACVDKSKDITAIIDCLRKNGHVKDIKWESFVNFKDPLVRINRQTLHGWIKDQKKIANIYL